MARQTQFLVFDIETNAVPFEDFDSAQQEYLLRGTVTNEDQEKKKSEMALTPLTSKVVCIGLKLMVANGDVFEEKSKRVFFADSEILDDSFVEQDLPSGFSMKVGSELTVLKNFWNIFLKGEELGINYHLISFNGRNFDSPFLMLRSAILGLRPTRNLMDGTRWNYPFHTDLIDELCFFSPQAQGATKRFNFDFYAKEFGITSPKADGIDGSKVGEFYRQRQFDQIADYCLRDVDATWSLFETWRKFLQFR